MFASVMDLVAESTDPENTIFFAANVGTPCPNSEQFIIENFHPVGHGGRLILTLMSFEETPTWIWNPTSYSGHTYSPLKSGSVGQWNVRADSFPFEMTEPIVISNSGPVSVNGFFFDGTTSGRSGILADSFSVVQAAYCRFQGLSAMAMAHTQAMLDLENCYLVGNYISVLGAIRGIIALIGNNYIESPIYAGIEASGDSLIAVMPWMQMTPPIPVPNSFNTTEFKTLEPRKEYVGLRLREGAKLKIVDVDQMANQPFHGHVVFNHDHRILPTDYKCIEMASRATIIGAENIEFLTKNLEDEPVAMPEANTIIEKENEQTLVID